MIRNSCHGEERSDAAIQLDCFAPLGMTERSEGPASNRGAFFVKRSVVWLSRHPLPEPVKAIQHALRQLQLRRGEVFAQVDHRRRAWNEQNVGRALQQPSESDL